MIESSSIKPGFAVVGCGKVGTALTKFLLDKGYRPVGFASRTLASARRLANLAKNDRFSESPWQITANAQIVFITTPDGAIEATCNAIAQNQGFSPGAIVLHCSGALSSTILKSAADAGAFVGSMHPLQSFASTEIRENPFFQIVISLEGHPRAVEASRMMSMDLGAVCMEIQTRAKMLYHAAAVVASNYLVTLMDLAFGLVEPAGIARSEALKAMAPLIHGTLANIEKVGIPEALTGPIARGDSQIVARHLEQIQDRAPGLLELYKTLGRHTVPIALAKKSLSTQAALELEKLLR
ncbi:MAG: DUF2520 domain-containing protein [Desulfobacterales bacterium]|nr:DUF2520 domain-containing protein [Desulfobacterales bacterium]MDD3081499.1 DUF2520 domain-containing protein [Desulfobacterales bacterium]MDD3950426.1 DUF2520 domain-containing protein [Desulfobacterales bacterium]MDY0378070.1 DUF2520 domain-containing protein [Desulfobacterales bacterium]